MINRGEKLSVTRQSELLGLNRSGVYYTPRPLSAEDLKLMRRIDELHLEHPFYGARRLSKQLQREGSEVGRAPAFLRAMRLFIRICSAAWRSSEPTRSGRAIVRIY